MSDDEHAKDTYTDVVPSRVVKKPARGCILSPKFPGCRHSSAGA